MDLSFYSFLIFNFLIITLLFKNADIISKKIGLNKKQDDQTPLVGGLGIFIFFILFNFYLFYFQKQLVIDYQFNILILISIIFIIGLIDDLFQLSYIKRLIFIYLIFIIFLKSTNFYIIDQLYFESINKTVLLGSFALYITPFFILLLLNSLNMADGINGNSGIIIISYLYLLYENNINLNLLVLSIIIPLILFLYFNLRNKIYLGDSGIYLLSSIIALYVINKYNTKSIMISCEEIFLIFLIPGLDMFRLFILRLLKKRNPFKGDNNHLHHLLLSKYNLKYTLLIYFILINWPNILYRSFKINILLLIFTNIFIFILFVLYLQKLKKFS